MEKLFNQSSGANTNFSKIGGGSKNLEIIGGHRTAFGDVKKFEASTSQHRINRLEIKLHSRSGYFLFVKCILTVIIFLQLA